MRRVDAFRDASSSRRRALSTLEEGVEEEEEEEVEETERLEEMGEEGEGEVARRLPGRPRRLGGSWGAVEEEGRDVEGGEASVSEGVKEASSAGVEAEADAGSEEEGEEEAGGGADAESEVEADMVEVCNGCACKRWCAEHQGAALGCDTVSGPPQQRVTTHGTSHVIIRGGCEVR